MFKLSPEVKKYYIENPEGLAIRKQVGIELIEYWIEQFDLKNYTKEIVEKYECLWDFAESYWIFPEEADYKKLIDEIYKKYVVSSAEFSLENNLN